MSAGITAINDEVQRASAFVQPLFTELNKVIIGQRYLLERLCIGLLANGHVLLEGVPGLAKTLAVKSLAASLNVKFSRLQFTPDMLPADVVGTQIYNPQSGNFTTRRGPIFANLVLAVRILGPTKKLQPAFIKVPLDIEHEFTITLFASAISLTPGTVSADLDWEGRYLLVHSLHVIDIDAAIVEMKQRYEAPLKEVFECSPQV